MSSEYIWQPYTSHFVQSRSYKLVSVDHHALSLDSSYSSFYSNKDLPVKLKLGKPVYVEVFLLKREDKELELRLEDCWATPNEDPLDQHRWNLLVKGYVCWIEFDATVYLLSSSTFNIHFTKLWVTTFPSVFNGRCPFSSDTHRTVVLPVVPSKVIKYPSHHKWFIVKQFAFVKPNQFHQLVGDIWCQFIRLDVKGTEPF